jgi:hypothetical protein
MPRPLLLLPLLAVFLLVLTKDSIEELIIEELNAPGLGGEVGIIEYVEEPRITSPIVTERAELIDAGYYQSGGYVYYAFTATNPNPGHAIRLTTYEVRLFDSRGSPIGGDSGIIPVIWPGETIATASPIRATQEPARIQVSFSTGTLEAAARPARLEPVLGEYQEEASGSRVRASVNNALHQDLRELKATAVLYDSDGEIIGGHFTDVDLLRARGAADVVIELMATPDQEPARVMVYTSFSNFTLVDSKSRQR